MEKVQQQDLTDEGGKRGRDDLAAGVETVNEAGPGGAAGEGDAPVKKPRTHRKRRICVLYGYLGKGYHGSMRSGKEELPTLEGEMEKALKSAGYIQDDLKNVSMSRSSRTDKGVSALVNAFGAQLFISEAEMADRRIWIDRVNSFLPPTIRIWHAFRVRGSFSAKDAPCSRTYDYVAPAFCFKPKDAGDDWVFDDEVLQEVNNVLLYYVGTHNFHNYTNGKTADSKDAKRVILSFKALTKTYIDGEEFVHIRIKGQSFMLHQIRKMMCMVMHIARQGFIKDERARQVIMGSFGRPHLNIMKAPAEGLFLKEVHFDVYNKHWGKGDNREPVVLGQEMEPVVEEFARATIWPEIAKEMAEFRRFLDETEQYPMDFDAVIKTCGEMDESKKKKLNDKEEREGWVDDRNITNFD